MKLHNTIESTRDIDSILNKARLNTVILIQQEISELIVLIKNIIVERFNAVTIVLDDLQESNEFLENLRDARPAYKSSITVTPVDDGFAMGTTDGIEPFTRLTFQQLQRLYQYGSSQSPPFPHLLTSDELHAMASSRINKIVQKEQLFIDKLITKSN